VINQIENGQQNAGCNLLHNIPNLVVSWYLLDLCIGSEHYPAPVLSASAVDQPKRTRIAGKKPKKQIPCASLTVYLVALLGLSGSLSVKITAGKQPSRLAKLSTLNPNITQI